MLQARVYWERCFGSEKRLSESPEADSGLHLFFRGVVAAPRRFGRQLLPALATASAMRLSKTEGTMYSVEFEF
jgi:hypothetical protein